MTPAQFRKIVWDFYRAHGRHDLPWRETHDVYKILVSEVMLQQTQVDRVIPFYTTFIKQFPTARRLAAAPLSEVLKSWQGLGYNRRAKLLREAARELCKMRRSDGKGVGKSEPLIRELEKLPGVGPYTARAVAAFAYNYDTVVIETNIRTVIIHHFFSNKSLQHQTVPKKVSDAEIGEILEKMLPKGKSREWYSALMDYGAHLKRTGVSHNVRVKGYMRQSKFVGSLRQVRGVILKVLAGAGESKLGLGERQLIAEVEKSTGVGRRTQIHAALDALCTEGFLRKKKGVRYALVD